METRLKLNTLFEFFIFLALKKMTRKDAESKKGKKRKYHRRHCLFAPPLVMRMPSLPNFPRLWWSHHSVAEGTLYPFMIWWERAGTRHYKSCYLWSVNPVKVHKANARDRINKFLCMFLFYSSLLRLKMLNDTNKLSRQKETNKLFISQKKWIT